MKILETATEKILVLESNTTGKGLRKQLKSLKLQFFSIRNKATVAEDNAALRKARHHRLMLKLAAGELTSIGEHV